MQKLWQVPILATATRSACCFSLGSSDSEYRSCLYIRDFISAAAALVFRVTSDFCQPDYKDRWQWAKCLTEGMQPYRDFNMLQTPLSLYYYSIFFRFSRSLHTGLLAASLLILLTGLLLLCTARRLRGDAPLLPIALWTAVMLLGQGAVYTSMSLLLWAGALYCYVRYTEKDSAVWLVPAALLCGLCFFAKQNAGALCCGALSVSFLIRWAQTKTPLKRALLHTALLLAVYAACWGLWLLAAL